MIDFETVQVPELPEKGPSLTKEERLITIKKTEGFQKSYETMRTALGLDDGPPRFVQWFKDYLAYYIDTVSQSLPADKTKKGELWGIPIVFPRGMKDWLERRRYEEMSEKEKKLEEERMKIECESAFWKAYESQFLEPSPDYSGIELEVECKEALTTLEYEINNWVPEDVPAIEVPLDTTFADGTPLVWVEIYPEGCPDGYQASKAALDMYKWLVEDRTNYQERHNEYLEQVQEIIDDCGCDEEVPSKESKTWNEVKDGAEKIRIESINGGLVDLREVNGSESLSSLLGGLSAGIYIITVSYSKESGKQPTSFKYVYQGQ
jgi:hypothetical protein